MSIENKRVVSWFSCGAASAVATKLALKKFKSKEIVIACCVIDNEHPDNERFMKDCEKWFGQEIVRLKSSKYKDCWDVWEREKYLVGPTGARCTMEMKKKVRQKFQRVTDIQVFGFTSEEKHRADRFEEQNPEVLLSTPLIDEGFSKSNCFQFLSESGIELPEMYKLGYLNNNCIGCVKGGAGYWNKIRKDFPEVFERMAKLERTIGATITKYKGKRTYLDELPVTAGRYNKEPDIQCGLWCGKEK